MTGHEPIAKKLQIVPPAGDEECLDLGNVRRFTAQLAALAGFEKKGTHDVGVAVSEAVLNALKYADAEFVDLEGVVSEDSLTVTLRHPGAFDTLKEKGDTKGLGIPLIAFLCDEMTVQRMPGGMEMTIGFRR